MHSNIYFSYVSTHFHSNMFKNAHVKMFGFVIKVVIFFRCYYTMLHSPA